MQGSAAAVHIGASSHYTVQRLKLKIYAKSIGYYVSKWIQEANVLP